MLLEFAGKWDWLPWTGCWPFDFVLCIQGLFRYHFGSDLWDFRFFLLPFRTLLFVQDRTWCGLTCPCCTLQRRAVGDFATRIYRTATRSKTMNTVIHLITMPS